MLPAMVELLERIRQQSDRYLTLGEEQAKHGVVVSILQRRGRRGRASCIHHCSQGEVRGH